MGIRQFCFTVEGKLWTVRNIFVSMVWIIAMTQKCPGNVVTHATDTEELVVKCGLQH